MPGPPAAVAATRVAVRRWLQDAGLPPGALVLAACSGGADSLALVAATAFVAPRTGLRVGALVVDHGLQAGSAQVAERAAEQCRALLTEGGGPQRGVTAEGLEPQVEVVRVEVRSTSAGPEADARQARYAGFATAARRVGAAAVLLGHTCDDQAEQVLLGLTRGSGTRSLAGMPTTRILGAGDGAGGAARQTGDQPGADECATVLLGRPLLQVGRVRTRQACADLGLEPWADPHNDDHRFARVRARRALADLEAGLGPGLARGLARSADLLRDDADALDEVTQTAYLDLGGPPWPADRLAGLPRAVRTRLWRQAALGAGSPRTDLTSEHLLGMDTLVTAWRGQGPLHLPGGVRAGRDGNRVWVRGPGRS